MIVISDTSPLNYLVLIQCEHVLPDLFGRVLAPPAVVHELQHQESPPSVRSWTASPPKWLEIRRPATVDATLNLGPGETEAISLARELRADVVLIGERKAAVAARQRGLFVAGTLGVLIMAADKKLIRIGDAVAALRRTTFRASEDMLDAVLARNQTDHGDTRATE